jgi:hypothetical protein
MTDEGTNSINRWHWLPRREEGDPNRNIFQRENTLVVGAPGEKNAITGMRIVMSNHFAPMPVVGHEYASAQFLGHGGTEFSMTIASVGDDSLKRIQKMVEETQFNARRFRRVKGAARVSIEGNPLLELAKIKNAIVSGVRSFTDDNGTDLYGMELTFTADNSQQEQLNQELHTDSSQYWRVVETIFDNLYVETERRRDVLGPTDSGQTETPGTFTERWEQQQLEEGTVGGETAVGLIQQAREFGETAVQHGIGSAVRQALTGAGAGRSVVVPDPSTDNQRYSGLNWLNRASEEPAWFRAVAEDAIELLNRHKHTLPIHEFFSGPWAGEYIIAPGAAGRRQDGLSQLLISQAEERRRSGELTPVAENSREAGTSSQGARSQEPRFIQSQFHQIPSFLTRKTYGFRRYYQRPDDLGNAIRSYLNDLLALGRRVIDQYSLEGEFESLFPGLRDEMLEGRRRTVNPCYPDLILPPHPSTDLVIDTEPDFYFWNDSEELRLNEIGPEVDNRINTRLDRLATSFNLIGQGDTWRQHYIGRNLYGPEGLDSSTDYSLSGQASKQEGWNESGPVTISHVDPNNPNRLAQLERILVGAPESAVEAVMSISPTVIGSTEQESEDMVQRRREMYSNTVYANPNIEDGSQMTIGPIDSEAVQDADLEQEGFLGHTVTRDNIYRLAVQSFSQNPDSTLTMRRAFPSFKLYFIEDDTGSNRDHLLPTSSSVVAYFDDFYSYNSIQDLRVVRSRKQPADLMIATMTNISGLLDQRRWRRLSAEAGENVEQTENWEPGLADTELENPLKYLILKPGQKVQLRLGYTNNPLRMPVKFIGEIVEVSFNNDSPDLITIVAQSYGTELITEKKGQVGQNITGFRDTADLLHTMMCSPELAHFGRFDLNPEFNPAEARSRISGGTGRFLSPSEWLDLHRDTLVRTRTRWLLSNNPSDDNIYAPDPARYMSWWQEITSYLSEVTAAQAAGLQPMAEFFRDIANDIPAWLPMRYAMYLNPAVILEAIARNVSEALSPHRYIPMNVTVWEMFKEMELRHPGYIGHPRPYGSRATMFFGLPDQRYWADQMSQRELHELRIAERQYTGIQRAILTRGINSATQVLSGNLRHFWGVISTLGDALDLRTHVNNRLSEVGQMVGRTLGRFRPFRKYHFLSSNYHILLNNIRASNKNTFNTVNLTYADSKNYTLRADDNIPDDKLRVGFFNFPNCLDETSARRYSIGLLMRHLKDVYKGELVVTGMNVDPYDVVMLYDSYTDMYGPFEVEQVVDTFNENTGWITELTPDLCVHANEWSTTGTLDLMGEVAGELWTRYLGNSTLTSAGVAAGAVVAAALTGGGAVFAGLAAGGILAASGGYMFLQYTQEREPIWLQPLILNNRPFLEGLDGFKRDGVFANLSGKLIAEVDNVTEGWRGFHVLPYLQDWTIGIAQSAGGQGGTGALGQSFPAGGGG